MSCPEAHCTRNLRTAYLDKTGDSSRFNWVRARITQTKLSLSGGSGALGSASVDQDSLCKIIREGLGVGIGISKMFGTFALFYVCLCFGFDCCGVLLLLGGWLGVGCCWVSGGWVLLSLSLFLFSCCYSSNSAVYMIVVVVVVVVIYMISTLLMMLCDIYMRV